MDGVSKIKEGGSGSSGGTGGGGTGIKSTWKKLKGKKKKQRNMTAPEIRTQDLKDAINEHESRKNPRGLAALKEDEDDKKGGEKSKSPYSKKQIKEKSSTEPLNSSKLKSPEVSEIVFRNERAESPVSSEETLLSQPILSESSDSLNPQLEVEIELTSPSRSENDVIILEPLELSQASGSGKHSGVSLSQSETYTGTDEHVSTQSSSDVVIVLNDDLNQESNFDVVWNDGSEIKEEQSISVDDYAHNSYLNGSAMLYEEFGSKHHKLNLERVHEFLESSKEMKPWDLSLLNDWDGWMVARKNIV